MAKADIKFGINDGEKAKIVVAASQNPRFLKVLDRQIKNGFGRNRATLAKNYVNEAIKNIKERIRTGFEGASTETYSGPRWQSGAFIAPTGLHAGNAASFSATWDDLANVTIRRKSARGPAKGRRLGRLRSVGKGKFWLDRGSLRKEVSAVTPAKVSYKTKAYPDSVRRQGKKDSRIDFAVTISFGGMSFPFDDLVRRPLVTGEYGSYAPNGRGGSMALKILANEYGTEVNGLEHAPARAWIRELSANIGNVMFEDLITNR